MSLDAYHTSKHMPRQISILFLLLLAVVTCQGQATQPCIVKRYNQKQSKTPLADVLVEVRGANTAYSDAAGVLTLRFTTLKAGDRVTVRSISKPGYQIFNKTALEQWNISSSSKPFEIVLVENVYFNNLKAQLKESSKKSYETKYLQAKAELEKEKERGRLKEAEFNQRIKELDDNYDNMLTNIDTYVDQFARFDLSELSEVEQKILDMVHQGKLDEAVKAYEELNAIEKYESAVKDKVRLEEHIQQASAERDAQQAMVDSIYAILQRQSVTLSELRQNHTLEDYHDAANYKVLVKSALDTFELLYAKEPERYEQDLKLLREEWARIKDQ